MNAEEDTSTFRVVDPAQYCATLLGYESNALAALLMVGRLTRPGTEERRRAEGAVLRAYRERYNHLLLPPLLLERLKTVATGRIGARFVARLEEIRNALFAGSPMLREAISRRQRLRLDAVVAGAKNQVTIRQTALLELFIDLVFLQVGQRHAIQEAERADAAAVSARVATLADSENFVYRQYLEAVSQAVPLSGPSLKAVDRRAVRAFMEERGEVAPLLGTPASAGGGEAAITPQIAPVRARGGDLSLATYGTDLVAEAAAGRLPAVVGRDQEISAVVAGLLRRSKTAVALLGDAGTGKTAVVEGLAARIARGDVPAPLKGYRIYEVPIAGLVAGTRYVGDLERRILPLIETASDPANRAILFFDELHTLSGAGASSTHPSSDIANIMKPALARGRIKIIGATTDAEYRAFIAHDAALERRFQRVGVAEPDRRTVHAILESVRAELERSTSVRVPESAVQDVLREAERVLPGRRFPDKGIDLLETAVTEAQLRKADVLAPQDLASAGERLTGTPSDILDRLEGFQAALAETAGLDGDLADSLARQLRGSFSGHAFAKHRPRAVVAVTGRASAEARGIARTVADELFGGASALFEATMGGLVQPADFDHFLGGRQGPRVSSDSPLQRASRAGCGVLLLRDVDRSPAWVRFRLAQALRDGLFVDAGGAPLMLTHLVVVLAGGAEGEQGVRRVGFQRADPEAPDSTGAGLGPDLGREVDVWVAQRHDRAGPVQAHPGLRGLRHLLKQRGVVARFSSAFSYWWIQLEGRSNALERLVDQHLLEALLPFLSESAGGVEAYLDLRDGRPVVAVPNQRVG